MIEPSIPGVHDLGRLNVAPNAEPPALRECRFCRLPQAVRNGVKVCARCDMTAAMPNPPRREEPTE